jgi:hypothetical protein
MVFEGSTNTGTFENDVEQVLVGCQPPIDGLEYRL